MKAFGGLGFTACLRVGIAIIIASARNPGHPLSFRSSYAPRHQKGKSIFDFFVQERAYRL